MFVGLVGFGRKNYQCPPRAVIIFNQTIPFQSVNQLFHDLGFVRAVMWRFTAYGLACSCVNICDEVARLNLDRKLNYNKQISL